MSSESNKNGPPEWNAELGVWVGERAGPVDASELPDPLYILGYGSLIWRPGPLLEKFNSFKCTALGWKRLFAQRSCDHRGTPEFPGLVLNLVQDSVLQEHGFRSDKDSESEFQGLVFHIPKEDVVSVIDELDFRERGGYHRHLIKVKLHKDGTVINAVVYTGAPSNPNFHLPNTNAPITNRIVVSTVNDDADPFRFRLRNTVTDTIAAAVGPSGPNVDYLCNLERYLCESNMHDPLLTLLATSVRLRLGVFRSRLYRFSKSSTSTKLVLKPVVTCAANDDGSKDDDSKGAPLMLLGFGSNEFGQLSAASTRHEHWYSARPIVHVQASAPLPRAENVPIIHPLTGVEEVFVAAGGATTAVLHTASATVFLTGKLLSAVLNCIEGFDATKCAAAGADAVTAVCIAGVHGVAVGHDHLLLLMRKPVVDPSIATFSDVAGVGSSGDVGTEGEEDQEVVVAVGSDRYGQCSAGATSGGEEDVMRVLFAGAGCSSTTGAGVRYALVQRWPTDAESSSTVHCALVALADTAATGFATTPVATTPHVCNVSPSPQPVPAAAQPVRFLKVAVGLRHSAVVTAAGALFTWGDNTHGQVGRNPLASARTDGAGEDVATATEVQTQAHCIGWLPLNGAKVVDVACGARYTIVIDDLGVVYITGTVHRGSAAGRQHAAVHSPHMVVLPGLPAGVRFQRVGCISH
jgi:glutathione-specific gamma-glutamylcyclotransferase